MGQGWMWDGDCVCVCVCVCVCKIASKKALLLAQLPTSVVPKKSLFLGGMSTWEKFQLFRDLQPPTKSRCLLASLLNQQYIGNPFLRHCDLEFKKTSPNVIKVKICVCVCHYSCCLESFLKQGNKTNFIQSSTKFKWKPSLYRSFRFFLFKHLVSENIVWVLYFQICMISSWDLIRYLKNEISMLLSLIHQVILLSFLVPLDPPMILDQQI